MYVCICKQVTDKHIKIAIEKGCCTMKALCNELGVAKQCGKCKNHARALLNHQQQPQVKMNKSD